MTENQERAKKFLQQLYDARIKYEQLRKETEELRSKAEHVVSALPETGDTGRTYTDKRGRKIPILAPIPRGTTNQGNERLEQAYCLLADKSTQCDIQLKRCESIYDELDSHIDWLVESELSRAILRLRHFSDLSFEKIGEVVSYSDQQTRRIYYSALEELGAGL